MIHRLLSLAFVIIISTIFSGKFLILSRTEPDIISVYWFPNILQGTVFIFWRNFPFSSEFRKKLWNIIFHEIWGFDGVFLF